jgi:hypothetical protein
MIIGSVMVMDMLVDMEYGSVMVMVVLWLW